MARKTKKRRYRKYRTVRSGALRGRRILTKAARKRIAKRAMRHSAAARKHQLRDFNARGREFRAKAYRLEEKRWVFVDYITSNTPLRPQMKDLQHWCRQDYGPGVYKITIG